LTAAFHLRNCRKHTATLDSKMQWSECKRVSAGRASGPAGGKFGGKPCVGWKGRG
jgi:hypothetical protein